MYCMYHIVRKKIETSKRKKKKSARILLYVDNVTCQHVKGHSYHPNNMTKLKCSTKHLCSQRPWLAPVIFMPDYPSCTAVRGRQGYYIPRPMRDLQVHNGTRTKMEDSSDKVHLYTPVPGIKTERRHCCSSTTSRTGDRPHSTHTHITPREEFPRRRAGRAWCCKGRRSTGAGSPAIDHTRTNMYGTPTNGHTREA